MAKPETLERLLNILEREAGENDLCRFVDCIMDIRAASGLGSEENYVLLEERKAGILEGPLFGRKQ